MKSSSEYRIWKRKLLKTYRNLSKCICDLNSFLFTVLVCALIFLLITSLDSLKLPDFLSLFGKKVEKIDWHDWNLIAEDQFRTGIGEHGEAAYLKFYPASTKQINDTHGYNGYLSDKIALNRSLKDLRPKQYVLACLDYGMAKINVLNSFFINSHFRCIYEKYSSELPMVSVIIIFHNEHLSTLLRTCYSVLNRTPDKLLTEIILVDDASTIPDLGNDLTVYIRTSLPMVKLIRLEQRSGLIKARVVGAKAAKSEILVFLDSHCEAYHNWLPPLLGM